jgi:hypothetical protein
VYGEGNESAGENECMVREMRVQGKMRILKKKFSSKT